MNIRKSRIDDIPKIMLIFDCARKYMRANNNMSQWNDTYPAIEDILNDITKGNSYIGENNNGEIIFTFAFIIGEDSTYNIIREGKWLNEELYGTIHRIASNGESRGVLKKAVDYCIKYVSNIRIDTHEDNLPMLRALNNTGFQKCGIIICRDGTPRIAFQKIKDNTI